VPVIPDNDRKPTTHAAAHTDGTDDIQDATASQKGLSTSTQITKLDGVATGAEVNPAVVSQGEAEAGTATTERIWTAQRIAQAIAALESGGGGGGAPYSDIAHDAGASTSGTDTLVLSITPPSGTYMVHWDGWGFPGANAAQQQMAIYVAGTKDTGSVRGIMRGGGQTSGLDVGFACTARVTVNGSQAIEGRLTGVAGDPAEIFENTLSIIEVST
jgi:hypothetical protein